MTTLKIEDTLNQTLKRIIAQVNLNTEQLEPKWDDLKFAFTQTKQGANLKPDFDFTNLGALFPQNDANEKMYAIGQFPHAYMLGTNLKPHIHFIQTSINLPVFKMSYRWYINGGIIPNFTTITTTTAVFPYTSESILQILRFPEIDGSMIKSISSIIDIIIYRDDNIISGDVLAKEFDIHYRIDSNGSDEENEK